MPSMSDTPFRPVLAGQKALVIGVANDDSIAYGCAKAFRAVGADLAISWRNEKAKSRVEPLARALEASITGEVDVAVPGQLGPDPLEMGAARHPGPFDRLRA